MFWKLGPLETHPIRGCHSLELSVRPGGLVVHWDQKEEGHTGDVGVIAVALQAVD